MRRIEGQPQARAGGVRVVGGISPEQPKQRKSIGIAEEESKAAGPNDSANLLLPGLEASAPHGESGNGSRPRAQRVRRLTAF